MSELNELKERLYSLFECMCNTENNEELNITYDRISNNLSKLFDIKYKMIKEI